MRRERDRLERTGSGRVHSDQGFVYRRARSAWLRRWAIAPVVVLGIFVGLTGCRPDPPRSVGLLYGDSLSSQAHDYLIYLYGSGHPGGRLQVAAQGGSALCDWTSKITAEIASVKPAFVALEFYGNNLTSCVGAPGGGVPGLAIGSPAFLDVYARSMDKVVSAARTAKVPVYWVAAPPRHPQDVAPQLNQTFAAMAKARGMKVVDGSGAVADSAGRWTETMPCVASERPADGCQGGRIAVRAPDRVHFLANTSSYNAGALRWAGASVALLP